MDRNITCAVFENLAIRRSDKELPERETLLLQRHLQQCPHCTDWQRVLQQCHTALDIDADPELEADPDIHLRLRDALIQAQTAPRVVHMPQKTKTRLYQAAVAVAAALLVFFAGDKLDAPLTALEHPSTDPVSTVDTPIDSYRLLQQAGERQRLVHFQSEDSLSILQLAPRALLADAI